MPSPHRQLSLTAARDLIARRGFEAAPFGVGLEQEWFVVDAQGRAVTDTGVLRRQLEADGPLPSRSRITFEPGGQVEISTPPAGDGPGALAAADRDGRAVRARLGAAGFGCVAVGTDATGPRPLVLDDPRYRTMAAYFDGLGPAGATMMRNTAALQVNIGFAEPRDAQWQFAHDLAPVLAAMFAHSPLLAGRPTGFQSSRLAVWAALDPGRTRPVAGAGPGAGPAWAEYALAAPLMFVRDGEDWRRCPRPMTLARWIEDGVDGRWPDDADVDYHLTTLFPPVRPRGWLELRMLDALPHPWRAVAAAVTVTALTDPDVRSFLTPVLAGARDLWLTAAWQGVHDPDLAAGARAVLAATRPALGTAGYDDDLIAATTEFGDRYVARGRSLADDLLARWARRGRLAPDPDPVPVSSR